MSVWDKWGPWRDSGWGRGTVEGVRGVQKGPCWGREAAVHLFKCWVGF
jgi:hypothetical protein